MALDAVSGAHAVPSKKLEKAFQCHDFDIKL